MQPLRYYITPALLSLLCFRPPAAAAADFLQKIVLFQFTEPKPKWNQADRSTVPSVLIRAEGSFPLHVSGGWDAPVSLFGLFNDAWARATRTFISIL